MSISRYGPARRYDPATLPFACADPDPLQDRAVLVAPWQVVGLAQVLRVDPVPMIAIGPVRAPDDPRIPRRGPQDAAGMTAPAA